MRQSVSVYYYIDFFILFKLKITNNWSISRHFHRKLTNSLQIFKIDIKISEHNQVFRLGKNMIIDRYFLVK